MSESGLREIEKVNKRGGRDQLLRTCMVCRATSGKDRTIWHWADRLESQSPRRHAELHLLLRKDDFRVCDWSWIDEKGSQVLSRHFVDAPPVRDV